MLESVVEKTYQALLTVVQTTALSRKVLQRPPFTFLHKLLVETLGDYDIFTYQQLEFAELVTKEDKVRSELPVCKSQTLRLIHLVLVL